jgi:hypothetical protein
MPGHGSRVAIADDGSIDLICLSGEKLGAVALGRQMRIGNLTVLFAWILWPTVLSAQDSAEIEAAVNIMVRLCLGGGHTEAVSGGATGGVDLSLRSLDAKGKVQGEFKVTKSSAEGLVDGINNAMTQIAANQADKVRTCLQPVRDRILDVMLPSNKRSAPSKQRAPPPASVAGRWQSDVFIDPNLSGEPQRQFYFTFKQMGDRLFGDVVDVYPPEKPTGRPYGLSGKVDGSNISFEFKTEWSLSGVHKELFYGKVLGEEIHFTYAPENLRSTEFVAKRTTSAASDSGQ